MQLRYLFVLVLFFRLISEINAQQPDTFFQIDLKKEVGSTTWRYIKKGFQQGKDLDATAIILNMNTYGGTVVHADSIRTAILNSPLPVYAFIDNNAASAGALIAIACDSIYMRKGANIGAATVVDQSGSQMPDKYQSYMRAIIRSTAESQGKDTVWVDGKIQERWRRDPRIAEAMVDDRIVIPNLVDSGKVLTLTATEAIKAGYCEGYAESVSDLIKNRLNEPNFRLLVYKPTVMDDIMGWLTSPGLQAFLILVIVLGIYYELQTPGLGFPSIAAIALYFAPLYIEGLASNWEIAVFVIGVVLLICEFFVIPGFGLLGFLGITLMAVSLILAMLDNVRFNFDSVSGTDAQRAILTVSVGIIVGLSAIIYLLHRIGSKGFMQKLALNKEEKVSEGYVGVDADMHTFVGCKGHAATILRPSGKVLIEGHYYDAVAMYGCIERNAPIEVVRFENAQLYVKEIK